MRSAIELTQPRSTTQQHLHMDSVTDDTHYRDVENQHALQSTDQPQHPKTNTRLVSTKQKPVKQQVQSSSTGRLLKGPSIPDQDKTLANLEKLRQKLLEEKQKHLDALKQQELKRLRKQKREQAVDLDHTYASFHSNSPKHATERPRSSSMPSTRQSDFKQSLSEESESSRVTDRSSTDFRIPRTSPLRRPLSMPPGEMSSILELSGENLDFDIHNDDNIEPESSSDKENHVADEVLRGNRIDTVGEGAPRNAVTVRRNGGQNMYPFPLRKQPKRFVPGEDDKVLNKRFDFSFTFVNPQDQHPTCSSFYSTACYMYAGYE